VTVIKGLINQGDKFQEVLTMLKTLCGAGGTMKDETLEIQGEHTEKIQQKLKSLGYKIK
jgi:translation initiation factor 1